MPVRLIACGAMAIVAACFAAPMRAVAEQSVQAGGASIACPGASIDGGDAARGAAERAFRKTWLTIGLDSYSTYELRPPPRNPFDIAAAKAGGEPIVRGVVWVQGIACRATVTDDGQAAVFAYAADVLSFHESGAWSRPMRRGVLAVIAVHREGDRWSVQDVGTEIAVFIPGAHLAAPAAGDIPAPDRKLGIPCTQGAAFVRGRCQPPARAARASR